MNVFEVFEHRLRLAIDHLAEQGTLPKGLDLSRVVVEPPRDPAHGDLATNAAMCSTKRPECRRALWPKLWSGNCKMTPMWSR
jgi:arginyl-tRNA synthetase